MKWLPALMVLINLASAKLVVANEAIRCFYFRVESPSRDPHDSWRVERWCYQNVALGSGKGLYIFNADTEEVRPELALVKTPEGNVTHGSLLAGEISFHSVKGDELNPFPVPLAEPKQGAAEFPVSLHASARSVLSLLIKSDAEPADLSVEEGPQAAQARQPWRGYWWPYKNFPMGEPLAKYDRFVRARSGTNPGTYSWERSRHVYKGVWWEGHCNGWAASSIIRSQPVSAKTDSLSGVTFGVSDQKGILAETDYCARATLYGKRYRGGGDNIYDIDPLLFHRTLRYYIGNLGKPIAMDYRRDSTVDNHVVSGYGMQIVRTSPTTLSVVTTLRAHRYDKNRTEIPGIAPPYARVYKYVLTQDEGGRTIGGRWLSPNPDFLWAPLGQGSCERGGRELKENFVSEILRM